MRSVSTHWMPALLQCFGLLSIVSIACEEAPAAPRAAAAGIIVSDAVPRFEPALLDNTATTVMFIARGYDQTARLEPAALHVLDAGATESRWSLHLRDADITAQGAGIAPLASRSHYYHGREPTQWRLDVPHYRAVEYRAVYPGIDIVWHDNAGRLQYDFHLTPGADPERIRITFDGIDRLALAANGDLQLSADHGELSLMRPIAYQSIDGHRHEVPAAFALHEDDSVGFALGAWNPAYELVIDPVIRYSSYLGGQGTDQALALALDGDGNLYITGSTDSVDITPPSQPVPPRDVSTGADVYVAKFNPDGELSYLTYLSGNAVDVARAIAVDAAGRAYIVGQTNSDIFPLTRALGVTGALYGGEGDAFVARLEADGQLSFSSYLGGERLDNATALVIDAAQNIYVAGNTTSDAFLPVTGSGLVPMQAARRANVGSETTCLDQGQADCHQADGFLLKITGDDNPALVYATYLGGTGPDGIFALAVDGEGRLIAGGGTGSLDFPLPDPGQAYQPILAGGGRAIDGFIARLLPDGSALDYASYLGGNALDRIQGLALDSEGNIYATGITGSRRGIQVESGFPVTDSSTHGGGEFDAFMSKFSPSGAALLHSTYLGGAGNDQGLAITVDASDQPIVVGETSSNDFPTTRAWQLRRLGETDGFLTRYAAGSPSRLISSYLGGTGADRLTGVAVTAAGIAHVTGTSGSTNMPLVLPYQGEQNGALDAYIARIDLNVPDTELPDLRVEISADPVPVPQNASLNYEVIVDNIGSGDATSISLLLSVSNADLQLSAGCIALDDPPGALLCTVGDIAAGGTSTRSVSARPRAIGSSTLTAVVVRADQADIEPGNNVVALERRIVDNSGSSGALSWPMLVLMLLGLALRRMARLPYGRPA